MDKSTRFMTILILSGVAAFLFALNVGYLSYGGWTYANRDSGAAGFLIFLGALGMGAAAVSIILGLTALYENVGRNRFFKSTMLTIWGVLVTVGLAYLLLRPYLVK